MKTPRRKITKVTRSQAPAKGIHGISDDRSNLELTEYRRQLKEILEQQRATSDILRVINSSPTDPRPVFDTIVRNARQLCGARFGVLHRFDGERLHVAAYDVTPDVLRILQRAYPMRPSRSQASGRAILSRNVAEIRDVREDPEYQHDMALAGEWRSLLAVPMLRADGTPMGTIVVQRSEPGPFPVGQIEMLKTFADQAVIAIENVRLFNEIQDKSRQLELASQHKSQFLANMSHELRTPLNAILGYTELMADGVYGPATGKMISVLKRLESNGRHLLGLVNDVLDLSKIEAGQLTLDLSPYTLFDVVDGVYGVLEPLAADKKLALKLEVAPDLATGRGDARRLAQVLINLVSNAVKFTDSGEVVITAVQSDGAFRVSVRDTGPGISIADHAKLFQEFQQIDNAATRKKGGTGLGLAISRRIIEMHGGRIWVESTVGEGSTFTFTLPVCVERQVSGA
jgi:signal transduction histidine kinase